MNDLVSVIIPSYERFDLLSKSIESVLNQDYKNIEIIVINDSSSDVRYSNIKNDNRIKYINLDVRLGYPGKVRNVGIKVSNGSWLAFLDDDDYWLPNKISKQMIHSKYYDFICSEGLLGDRKYFKEVYLSYWNRNNPNNTNELDYNILSNHNLIMNSSVVIKKDLLIRVGMYDETVRNGEDYSTWLKITRLGYSCFFVDEPLVIYNQTTHKHYTDNYKIF